MSTEHLSLARCPLPLLLNVPIAPAVILLRPSLQADPLQMLRYLLLWWHQLQFRGSLLSTKPLCLSSYLTSCVLLGFICPPCQARRGLHAALEHLLHLVQHVPKHCRKTHTASWAQHSREKLLSGQSEELLYSPFTNHQTFASALIFQ